MGRSSSGQSSGREVRFRPMPTTSPFQLAALDVGPGFRQVPQTFLPL